MVNNQALVTAESKRRTPEEATKILVESGLEVDEAEKVLAFQGDAIRRWKISSLWSTDDGQQTSELRGLDAGPHGQWLMALVGSRDQNGQMSFTPQGHGQMMKSLRSILPKHWIGTPLNPPPF